jgi:hypothetical protein
LKWNGEAKKKGLETGDIINEIRIENIDRPNKDWVYPFALIFLGFAGYYNYRKKA